VSERPIPLGATEKDTVSTETHVEGGPKTEPLPIHKRLLQGWGAISARFGFVQTLVILGFFYALLIGPIALAGSLTRRDPLDKRGLGSSESAWQKADSAKPDLERAKLTS
jgi:hypothetical protein